MKYGILGLLIAYMLGTTACNTTRFVKPLKKKELAVGLDFGGPIIDFQDLKIPVPFTSVSVGYGIDSTFTVFGGAHITSAVFGTAQLDLGVVKQILAPKGFRPGISISPVVNMMVDGFRGSFRLYPQVDVNLYWKYLPRHDHFFYLNWSSWLDFWNQPHNNASYRYYHPALGLGHTFENKKMRYTLEAKYMGFNHENGGTPVKFNGSGGYGSWGAYISVIRKF